MNCSERSVPEAAISVVIATLGGPTLADTLRVLNSGSLAPGEILVCIPQREAGRVAHLQWPNLRVLVTECRGQVAQRAEGFRQAVGPLVLQMDDDMWPAPDCLALLQDALHNCGPMAAVAPALTDRASGNSVYCKPAAPAWVQRLYYWLMNGDDGYAPGTVDRAGNAVGVDPNAFPGQRMVPAQWLAGGCVMHHKANLVLEHYFPLSGKAYAEDVIHSQLLQQRGVSLWVDTQARCSLEPVFAYDMAWTEFWKNLQGDWRARRYAMALRGQASPRTVLIYLVTLAGYLTRRLLARREEP